VISKHCQSTYHDTLNKHGESPVVKCYDLEVANENDHCWVKNSSYKTIAVAALLSSLTYDKATGQDNCRYCVLHVSVLASSTVMKAHICKITTMLIKVVFPLK